MATDHRTARRTGSRLLRPLVFALLLLAATELALRLARPHHEWLRGMLFDPNERSWLDDVPTTRALLERSILGYRPHRERCGFVLNSRGFRTPEYSERAAPGTYRIVVLGDSFAFASACVPWPDFWPPRLQTELERRREQPVEVINLGVPATAVRFQTRLWQLEGRQLAPDLVIVAFFVGNDLTEESGVRIEGGSRRWWSEVSVTARLVQNLLRLSRLPASPEPTILLGESHERGGFLVPGAGESYDRDRPDMTEAEHLRIEWNRLQLFRQPPSETLTARLDETARSIASLRDDVEQAGARLLVILIPDEVQVDDELFRLLLERHEESPETFDRELLQRALGERLEALGVEQLDLLPAFRAHAPPGESLYKRRNTHWNDRGSRLAARSLAEALR